MHHTHSSTVYLKVLIILHFNKNHYQWIYSNMLYRHAHINPTSSIQLTQVFPTTIITYHILTKLIPFILQIDKQQVFPPDVTEWIRWQNFFAKGVNEIVAVIFFIGIANKGKGNQCKLKTVNSIIKVSKCLIPKVTWFKDPWVTGTYPHLPTKVTLN